MNLKPNCGIPADPLVNEYRLRHVGRISYSVFEVSLPSSCGRKAFVSFGIAAQINSFCVWFQGTVAALSGIAGRGI